MPATTVFVAVSITEMFEDKKLVTYAKAPFGFIAIPVGNDPTGTVAITVLLAALITETVLPKVFAT
jgi:hypothetical protein